MSRRARWAAMPPIEGLSFQISGKTATDQLNALADYLDAANLRVSLLDETGSLKTRMTRFPELTFAHARVPRALIEWPRDQLSRERAAIILCRSGRLTVESTSLVLERQPGMFLVPPGDTTVSIEAVEPYNEVLYISAPASIVHGFDLIERNGIARPPVPTKALAPLYAFVNSLSSGTVDSPIVVGPLHAVAMEVARALARLIAEADPTELDLFARTMRTIVDGHADPRLTVSRLARLTAVSERSLQLAFAAHGTTVAQELRAARTRAARELRRESPALSSAELAQAVGFGSVSSYYRALAADADSDEEPGEARA